jgi:hypothetical protein
MLLDVERFTAQEVSNTFGWYLRLAKIYCNLAVAAGKFDRLEEGVYQLKKEEENAG